jgi:hypothetical protein
MGKLVWLASYPKSGNTWLRAFLHNYILQPDQPHDINALGDLSVSESTAAFFNKYDSRPAGTYTTNDVQRMRPLVHADFTGFHPDLVFVKTHNAALSFHDVPLCMPSPPARLSLSGTRAMSLYPTAISPACPSMTSSASWVTQVRQIVAPARRCLNF